MKEKPESAVVLQVVVNSNITSFIVLNPQVPLHKPVLFAHWKTYNSAYDN